VNALQRARLASQLAAVVAELGAVKTPIQRARLAKSVNDLLAQLGGKGLSSDKEKLLTDIAEGRRDGAGLDKLYDLIHEAVMGLEAVDALSGDAELTAQSAVTHWAELEEQTNG
jgi:hypothetical protein